MKEKTPIVTVTCVRDLPLLDLQAQSIFRYLDNSTPVYIVVNEADPTFWIECFNKNLRQYYQNHFVTILTRNDFKGAWNTWIPSKINPWEIGWETQQVLKLLIAHVIKEPQYLVLDSQNFLIKDWSPEIYELEKVPARCGNFVMPVEIWDQYCKRLGVTVTPTPKTVSMCTPIFFDTAVVNELIDFTGGYDNFAWWFKTASRIKSEFILYALWLEKLGGVEKYHHMIPISKDWGNPMLRDCRTEEEFKFFLEKIGVHGTHAWVSANHRAWGNMTAEQYERLCNKLSRYKLNPNFDEYRSTYVDLKF